MLNIYSTAKTAALPATGTLPERPSKIKVRNLATGRSLLVPWDHAFSDGLDQHYRAVWQCAATATSVKMGAKTTHGYLFAVESEDQ